MKLGVGGGGAHLGLSLSSWDGGGRVQGLTQHFSCSAFFCCLPSSLSSFALWQHSDRQTDRWTRVTFPRLIQNVCHVFVFVFFLNLCTSIVLWLPRASFLQNARKRFRRAVLPVGAALHSYASQLRTSENKVSEVTGIKCK